MTAEPLRFYFDFISPFAYLGWTQVGGLARRHGRTLEPIPVLFAATLNHWGHKGPVEIPPKRTYTFKYAVRLAHDLGAPIAPPPAHPFNPLLALRVAAIPMSPEDRIRAIDLMFRMTWVTQEGVTDPVKVTAALSGLGLDGPAMVAAATSQEGKDRIKTNSAAAIEAGVFGVPTVIVDNELFWGQDSFPHIERFLRGEDPADAESLARWMDLPAAANR